MVTDQYNKQYTLKEMSDIIQDAHNAGYDVTIIINGQYYVMEVKNENV